MKLALLVLALLSAGCGESSPSVPPRQESPDPPDEAPVAEEAPSPPAADRARLDAEQRARLRALVREGRRASRAGRHAEALAPMEEALTLDPANRRLRCEVGYVAFLARERERASMLIMQALAGMDEPDASAPEVKRNEYAMCLYNAGLVYEAAGRTDDARDAWERSLALRSNATVERRLAALRERASPPSQRLRLDPGASFEALGRAIRDFYCRKEDSLLLTTVDQRCEDVQVHLQAPAGTGSGLDARIVRLQLEENEAFVLLLRAGRQLAAFELSEVFNPGAFGVLAEGGVGRFELADAIPGGGVEVRLDHEHAWRDLDMAGCAGSGQGESRVVLCTADGGLRCGQLVTSESDTAWCDVECIGEGGAEFCAGQPLASEENAPTRSYRLDVSLTDGQAQVSIAERQDREPPEGIVGAHPIATILRDRPLAPLSTELRE